MDTQPYLWIRNFVFVLFAGGSALPLIAQQGDKTTLSGADDDEVVMLSEFEVKVDNDDGYRAANSISGTRFNTSLLDLPKPVDVITEEFIRDIAATNLTEILSYSAPITTNSAPGVDDITGSSFTIRGFSTFTTYRNGFRAFGIVDPSAISRVEIIKGPSSVFSGTIEPGGTINVITAKPSFKRTNSVSFRGGSYDRYRYSYVGAGPINDAKTMAYRFSLAVDDQGSPRDFAGKNAVSLGGSYLWKIGKKGEFLWEGSYINNRVRPSSPSAYLANTSPLTEYVLDVPYTFNRQGPFAYSNLEQYQTTVTYTQQFNPNWSARLGAYYRYQSLARLLATGSLKLNTNSSGLRTASRSATFEPNADSFGVSPQAYLLGKLNYPGGIEHRIIVGGEYYLDKSRNDVFVPNRRTSSGAYTTALTTINVDNPGDISNYAFPIFPDEWRYSSARRNEEEQISGTVNNIFTWRDRVTLLQAVRYTNVVQRNHEEANFLRGLGPIVDTTQSDGQFAQSYGVSYRIMRRLTGFVSYSESFVPQSSKDINGDFLPPIEGSGWDYGIKFDIIDGRLSGSVVGYDIIRANAATPAGSNSPVTGQSYYLAVGESESRGAEFSVLYRPIDEWQITFSYSYIDATVTKENRTDRIGGRVPNIPEYQGSLWNRYKFSSGPLKGLGIGIGITRVGSRRPTYDYPDVPGLELPYYTRVSGNITYSRKLFGYATTFGFGGENLLDDTYQVSSTGFAEPRALWGSVNVRF